MSTNNKNHRVLVLGASLNPERYSHKVALQLNRLAYDVVLVGHKPGVMDGLVIETQIPTCLLIPLHYI